MSMPPDFDFLDMSALEEEVPAPFQLGTRAIQKILDSAFDDRKSSKVAINKLKLSTESPGYTYMLARWRALFCSFYKNTLRKQ